MNYFWEMIGSNALVATVLALGVGLLGLVWKNAAAVHLLWVIVLLKLFMPPIVTSRLPIAANWFGPPAVAKSADTTVERQGAAAKESALAAGGPKSEVAEIGNAERQAAPTESHEINSQTARSLLTLLAAAWTLGSVCIAAVYAIRIHRFARVLRDVEPAAKGIREMVNQLAGQLGLSRVPSVAMTRRVVPPLVWYAWFRPRLILPAVLFGRLSQAAQSTILAHELAHVRRGDCWVRFLEMAATTFFWWHPVVWWARRQLHELEEQCCDRQALNLAPNQGRAYAAALVETLEFLAEQPRILLPLPTAVYSAGSLSRRIRMLTENHRSRLGVRSALLVAAIAAMPLAFAFAAEPPKDTKDVASVVEASSNTVELSGRVTNEAGELLDGVRVVVAIPAMDMRFLDSATDHKRLEAKSTASGEYRLEIPGVTQPTKISVDAMLPGYGKLAGPLMSGNAGKQIEIIPGKAAEASFALKRALYLKGVVVDEQGKPVPGAEVSANADGERFSAGIERTITHPDGTFELFNYPSEPPVFRKEAAKGRVSFSHPNYLESAIDNIYELPEKERDTLRIVLGTGRRIEGTVVDDAGKPVAGVMIVADHNRDSRKAMRTDATGKFDLRGLMPGATRLRAHALDLKQKIEMQVDLESNKSDVEVRLKPITLAVPPKPVSVLGMQLTDATPELQAVYDQTRAKGALILDPGKEFKRLKIGDLAEGDIFWVVGEGGVGDVREFIQGILNEVAKQKDGEYSVRVVYSFEDPDFVGTNTQYLKLTKDDVEQLKKVLVELKDK